MKQNKTKQIDSHIHTETLFYMKRAVLEYSESINNE